MSFRQLARASTRARCRRLFASEIPKKNPAAFEDSMASGANALYLESLYCQWKANPASLSSEWETYFRSVDGGGAAQIPVVGSDLRKQAQDARLNMTSVAGGASTAKGINEDLVAVANLVLAYQRRGHEIAKLDPLNLNQWREQRGFFEKPGELSPSFHGLNDQDLDRELNLSGTMGQTGGFLSRLVSSGETVTLRQVIEKLEATYCQGLGVEYMHIMDMEKTNWIRERVEDPSWPNFDKPALLKHYERLCNATEFEQFLGKTFKTTKRFGLDGCETAIPGMKAGIKVACDNGAVDIVVGMAHRGRLNVLGNVMYKPLPQLLSEFQDTHYDLEKTLKEYSSKDWAITGDVKYHLGTFSKVDTPDGFKFNLTLEANPSHLETVNPIALGRTRAKQFYAADNALNEEVETQTNNNKKKVLPILIHGDASFAGQGIVYESMQLANVTKFSVGGSIHVVLNNQVGFTTNPWDSRSTLYCSDVGKAFNCPIFHCNGDDLQSVVSAFMLAAEYRQTFGNDVVIDLISYRRFGHNEIDNPDFTQPVLYKTIRAHKTSEAITAENLIATKVATQAEIDEIRKKATARMNQALEDSKSWKPANDHHEWVPTQWSTLALPTDKAKPKFTGYHLDELKDVGLRATQLPSDLTPHHLVKKTYLGRAKMMETGTGIDWGTAEMLAFGSLLRDGYHVRITGQDVGRGTFSHRHCILADQNDLDRKYVPLNHMFPRRFAWNSFLDGRVPQDGREPWDKTINQATFTPKNSILSEYGILGFELGYSYENPFSLCIWEAQFGDFVNGAQIIIDQFIASGENKWLQQSGLVMLLPHGYDGQGAEHSSCRVERFLQLADDDEDDAISMVLEQDAKSAGTVPPWVSQQMRANLSIVNCTTPANFFHVLRRQCVRQFRKPLIVLSPKKLLRLPICKSDMEDFGPEQRFQRVLQERDAKIKDQEVTRLIFCSGQIYYELAAEREKLGLKNVAIVTIEEIAPFPFDRALEIFLRYKNVDHGDGVHPGQVVWCQEEPKNNGAWSYVKPRLVTAAREGVEKDTVIRYCGRRAASAPATGYAKLHAEEQAAVIRDALLGHDDTNPRASALLGHQT